MSNQWKWKTEEIRFWEKVDKTPGQGPNGKCWQWTGGKRGSRTSTLSNTFYGGFRFREKVCLAHRVSFILTHGNIPESIGVLHRCDNPSCVRPSHLWLGTHIQNIRDAWKKGRGSRPINTTSGSARPTAKLTEAKVIRIRELINQGKSDRELGHKYDVCAPTIRALRLRITWKHI